MHCTRYVSFMSGCWLGMAPETRVCRCTPALFLDGEYCHCVATQHLFAYWWTCGWILVVPTLNKAVKNIHSCLSGASRSGMAGSSQGSVWYLLSRPDLFPSAVPARALARQQQELLLLRTLTDLWCCLPFQSGHSTKCIMAPLCDVKCPHFPEE